MEEGSRGVPEPGNAHDALIDRLVPRGGSWSTVLVVGPPDSGKTTLCARLASRLAERGPTVRIDCDPGQSSIGPPATVGAVRASAGGEPVAPRTLRFVGSTSPSRHFLQNAVGIARLLHHARGREDAAVVLDSSGYFSGGGGAEFHYQTVEAVSPDHLVALQGAGEMEPLLANFQGRAGMRIHRLPVPEGVRERSRAERRQTRRERFARHFRDATTHELSLQGLGLNGYVPELGDPGATAGLLVGLSDPDGFLLALGRLDGADPARGRIVVHAPPFERSRLAALSFGTLRLEPEETEETEESEEPDSDQEDAL